MNSGCVEDYRMLTVQENDSALASNFQINDNPVYKQYVQSEYFRKLNKDVYDNLLISDARTLELAVFLNGKEWGKGTGKTKKDAEQKAAKMALDKLKN